jgi:hypothetical protein
MYHYHFAEIALLNYTHMLQIVRKYYTLSCELISDRCLHCHTNIQEDYGTFQVGGHDPGTFSVPDFCGSADFTMMRRGLRGSGGASPFEVDAADPMGCFV